MCWCWSAHILLILSFVFLTGTWWGYNSWLCPWILWFYVPCSTKCLLNQLYLHIDSSFLLDGFVECIVLVILFKLDKCRMESCKPMMRKLAVFSSTPQCKCYFVPALLENDIVGSSRGLEMNNHFWALFFKLHTV